MTILRRFRSVVGAKADVETEDPNVAGLSAEKDAAHLADEIFPKDEEKPIEDAENGVEKIEAVTLAWSRSSLCLVLILIWFLTLANNMKGVTAMCSSN